MSWRGPIRCAPLRAAAPALGEYRPEEDGMGRFWLLKIARTLLTLLFVVTFTFVVLRTSGDPVQSLLGPDATNDEIAQFRE
jgi:hypothetical protein